MRMFFSLFLIVACSIAAPLALVSWADEKATYTHSFNRNWNIIWSWKQFIFGYSNEFGSIHIVAIGFFSVVYIKSTYQPKGGI